MPIEPTLKTRGDFLYGDLAVTIGVVAGNFLVGAESCAALRHFVCGEDAIVIVVERIEYLPSGVIDVEHE